MCKRNKGKMRGRKERRKQGKKERQKEGRKDERKEGQGRKEEKIRKMIARKGIKGSMRARKEGRTQEGSSSFCKKQQWLFESMEEQGLNHQHWTKGDIMYQSGSVQGSLMRFARCK